MSGPDQPVTPDRVNGLLEDASREEIVAALEQLEAASTETRKRVLRAVRAVATERPRSVEDLTGPLSAFLTDDDRAVRLTTAKLFVALARTDPAAVRATVDVLAGRLADEAEFYYVRARCAEALGYVALEAPDAVADPETLADLRIGLAFDEPEVTEKLAKALTYVALGDPGRLRHQVPSLAEHLEDETDLVRYHLCTALVVVGCEYPASVFEVAELLQARLDDDNPYVRGRAAEALGVLAAAGTGVESAIGLDGVELGAELDGVELGAELDGVECADDDAPSFATDRLAFCRRHLATELSVDAPEEVGTIESVREGTDDVVEEMTSPEEGTCPHCGLDLRDEGPPMCPRCGRGR